MERSTLLIKGICFEWVYLPHKYNIIWNRYNVFYIFEQVSRIMKLVIE